MKLKELRIQKNLKQGEIAKILNISQTCYSYYENGRNEPSIDVLIKLSKLFNVSVDELIGNDTNIDTLENSPFYQQEIIEQIKTLNQVECAKVEGFIAGLKRGKQEYEREKLFNKYKGEM